jgi:hypothetical protein
MKYRSVEEYLADWPDGVSGGKGDGTAKDQLRLENNRTDAAIARQNSQQDTVLEAIKKYLTSDIGFSPEALSSMNSDFLGQNDTAYDSASSAIKSALLRRGEGAGDLPVGGQFTSNIAGLEASKAGSQSAGLNQIRIQNFLQALQNRWNAANVATGNAAQSGGNIGAFTSGSSNALSNYVAAANTGFGNAFTTALGGSLGKGIGTVATGAIGNALDKLPGVSTQAAH